VMGCFEPAVKCYSVVVRFKETHSFTRKTTAHKSKITSDDLTYTIMY